MLSLSRLIVALEQEWGPLPPDTPIYQLGIQPVPRWKVKPPRPYIQIRYDSHRKIWDVMYVYGNLGGNGVILDKNGKVQARMMA